MFWSHPNPWANIIGRPAGLPETVTLLRTRTSVPTHLTLKPDRARGFLGVVPDSSSMSNPYTERVQRLRKSTGSQSPASTRAASRPRGRLLALVAALAFVAGACSGGGGGENAGLDEEYRPTPGERDVQIPGATKLKMGATLAVPVSAKGASPAVLIIPGPGATNRDGPIVARPADPLYKDLSTTLTGAGMVTLRYDHRGIGDSQMETGQQLSWDDMVEDAREALKYLGQRQEVDPNRMAVIGHDMGGVIAMKLAATDERIKGVALISTPGPAPGRRLGRQLPVHPRPGVLRRLPGHDQRAPHQRDAPGP